MEMEKKGFKNILDKSITTREVIFLLAVVFCLSPLISPPIALLMGLIIAQFIGHPYIITNFSCWFGFWNECNKCIKSR